LDEISITPLMPLDYWREIIGYNPWHFWGLADSSIVPVTSKCNDVVREHGWQGSDEAGREDIRTAIIAAEKLCYDNLYYWPAPAYSFETHPWPRYIDQRLARLGRGDARGNWINIQLGEGYVDAVGVEAFNAVQLQAGVVYSDTDGDGLDDTFTIMVATTVTDPKEIAVYFVDADRLPEDNLFSNRWRIEPVNVQISFGNAIITGKRWLAVKPILYEDKNNYPIDPTDDANFITVADVMQRYTKTNGTDPAVDSMAALIWETKPCWWGCDNDPTNSSTDPAAEGWVAARAGIRNSDAGIVTPAEAVYNASSGTWYHPNDCFSTCSEPDRVLVRYLAGMRLDSQGHMFRPMRTLVARLSCAEMTRRICACDVANREWTNWQFDVSRVNSPETYQMNLDTLSNPLGTRRGHIYAWQQFKSLARVVGMIS
jgi:hypothetical protein